MKKLKLFPKTFLYVFSLMAFIALLSHALFYFIMPVVYTGQKEDEFQKAHTGLVDELKNADPKEIEDIVSQFAIDHQLYVSLNYDGKSYNLMAISNVTGDSSEIMQIESQFTVDSDKNNAGEPRKDFYNKTNTQLDTGLHFETTSGKPCYLFLRATLQPVNEAKEAAVVLLPITLVICLMLSALFALLYSRKITRPLAEISEVTERMKRLDPVVGCDVKTHDEMGVLSKNINALYQSLLATIDDLQRENERVSEAEAAKVDFLRAASHELKTPVTALRGMLDNMIMGIGRYKDWETYLPMCRDMANQFGLMIQEILDTSKLHFTLEEEQWEHVRVRLLVEKALSPYLLIAKSKGVLVDTDLTDDFFADLPAAAMEKALSNIISNAVKYTKPSGTVKIYLQKNSIVVENECKPISADTLSHIFEPFYRPDFSRSRNPDSANPDGGNGLGLYITAKILTSLSLRYSFEPFSDQIQGMRFTVFYEAF